MKKYLAAIGFAIAAGLAFLAGARATQHRKAAKALRNADEAELKQEVATRTGQAKQRAVAALGHMNRARNEESKASALLDQAKADETTAEVLHRWRK